MIGQSNIDKVSVSSNSKSVYIGSRANYNDLYNSLNEYNII